MLSVNVDLTTAVAREQSVIQGGVMIAFDFQRVFQSHLLTCNGDSFTLC